MVELQARVYSFQKVHGLEDFARQSERAVLGSELSPVEEFFRLLMLRAKDDRG